jgi:hypothetical protein
MRLYFYASTLWAGGTVGHWLYRWRPILFSSLNDRALAGMVAGKLFSADWLARAGLWRLPAGFSVCPLGGQAMKRAVFSGWYC